MPIRGEALWLFYRCWDSAGQPLGSDLANHDVSWAADGVHVERCTNNQGGTGKHVEINVGFYAVLLTAAETDCDNGMLIGRTTTAGAWIETEQMSFHTKTGYSLAATGLDAIACIEPTSKPTTFVGWLMWLIQRVRRSSKTASVFTVETEAGATVTTQAITDDGAGNESIGAPS